MGHRRLNTIPVSLIFSRKASQWERGDHPRVLTGQRGSRTTTLPVRMSPHPHHGTSRLRHKHKCVRSRLPLRTTERLTSRMGGGGLTWAAAEAHRRTERTERGQSRWWPRVWSAAECIPPCPPVPHRRSVFVLALEVASIYLSRLLLLLRSPKCFFLIVRTIHDDLNIN